MVGVTRRMLLKPSLPSIFEIDEEIALEEPLDIEHLLDDPWFRAAPLSAARLRAKLKNKTIPTQDSTPTNTDSTQACMSASVATPANTGSTQASRSVSVATPTNTGSTQASMSASVATPTNTGSTQASRSASVATPTNTDSTQVIRLASVATPTNTVSTQAGRSASAATPTNTDSTQASRSASVATPTNTDSTQASRPVGVATFRNTRLGKSNDSNSDDYSRSAGPAHAGESANIHKNVASRHFIDNKTESIFTQPVLGNKAKDGCGGLNDATSIALDDQNLISTSAVIANDSKTSTVALAGGVDTNLDVHLFTRHKSLPGSPEDVQLTKLSRYAPCIAIVARGSSSSAGSVSFPRCPGLSGGSFGRRNPCAASVEVAGVATVGSSVLPNRRHELARLRGQWTLTRSKNNAPLYATQSLTV